MKIMNKLYRLAGGLMVSALLLSSCDFLDIVPEEQASLNDAWQDPQKSLGYLYSCYNGLSAANPTDYLKEDVSSTDEYVLPYLWNQRSQQIAWNTINSTNGGDWTWRYAGYDPIRTCFMFMEGVQTAPKLTDAQRTEWSAEAKFLVAYYHFMVLRKYGPCPVMDHAYDASTASGDMPGRSHFDYVVDYIVRIIDEAMQDLPANQTGSDWGRASKVVAKAVKAKVLLYAASPLWNGNTDYAGWQNTNYETPGYGTELVSQVYDPQKWERARAACQEALDFAKQQGYALYEKSDFDELKDMAEGSEKEFQKYVLRMRYVVTARPNSADGNREFIWGIPDQGSIVYGSLPHQMFKKTDGTFQSGYSGVAPTMYTIEHFYTKNGYLPAEDPAFATPSEWFTRAASGSDVIKLHTNREPRFYAWIGYDGGDYGVKLIQGDPLKLNMKSSEAQGTNLGRFERDNSQTGYLSQKFIHPRLEYAANGGNNAGELNVQRPLIRMAELYLSLAEAQVMCSLEGLGDYMADARVNLNMVRSRAGVPEVKTADFTRDKAMDWIRNERFIELWGEGQRYFDVRRWKLGEKLFNGPYYGLNAMEKNDPSFEEFNRKVAIPQQNFNFTFRSYLLPLYYNEVYKNPQMIQVPGY